MQDEEISIEDSSRLQLTKEEAQEAGKALSLYPVKSELIRKMQDLGVEVETCGVVKVANGFSFMTAECLHDAMINLADKSKEAEGKELHEFVRSLTSLATAMAKQTRELKQVAMPTGGPKTSNKMNPFIPGQVIDVESKQL